MSVAFGPDGPVHGQPVMLALSASRAASGNGPERPTGAHAVARLTLDVTVSSGGDALLDVDIETSPDGSAWATSASFAQVGGVSTSHVVAHGLDRYVRAAWTLSGSAPVFTFKVSGVLV